MVRLADQDRTRWDRDLIAEGHDLVRACLRRNQPGPFQIQAAIAAVHADAPTAERHRLVADRRALRPAPRAAAERRRGDEPGDRHRRAATARPRASPRSTRSTPSRSTDYQPYHAARADLLARPGAPTTRVAAYDRAIELTTNPAERRFLTARRAVAAG